MSQEIMVSIICNTYNQEDYIADALESFIMQKTSFKFEVLVHDDASTDATTNIVREYEKKYPDLIKPIYQKENMYSQNISIGKNFQYPRAKGKYVALCEGDDYWTDPLKLQKQFDAMEKHPEIDMCAHSVVTVNAQTKEKICYTAPSKKDTILSVKQVIMGEGSYLGTNSLFCRSSIIKNLPEFRKVYEIDYSFQIDGALRGGILYLHECMSAYRSFSKGSWTSRDRTERAAHMQYINNKYKMLDALDKETGYKYSKVIKARISGNKLPQLLEKLSYEELMKEPNLSLYNEATTKLKIRVLLYYKFPKLLEMITKLREKRWNKNRLKIMF